MYTTQAINGEIQQGDWVIVKPDNDYGCLVGQIEYIHPLGSRLHDEGHKTDDVHVSFVNVEYTKLEKARLLEAFSHLYPSAETFDDMPLDDVTMSPDDLICADFGAEHLDVLAHSYDEAEAYCNAVIAAQSCVDKLASLKERLAYNIGDYADSFVKLDTPQMLIMSKELAGINDMYAYMTEKHEYSEPELDYLLLFQDPLRVAANAWLEMGTADVSHGFYHAVDARNAILEDYALAGGIGDTATVKAQSGIGEEIEDTTAMPEMMRTLMLHEFAKSGFPQAEYAPESGMIEIPVDGCERPILITEEGYVRFMPEVSDLADEMKPIAEQVREIAAAWEYSRDMPVNGLQEFRLLSEYNGIVLAARDDTEHGRGLHFVTWEYNYERTGMYRGHYTEDYNYAKEDFAVRSGLIPEEKLLTPEQALEVKESIRFRLKNADDITPKAEEILASITGNLHEAYPAPEIAEQAPPDKKPSIAERLQAGKEKSKANRANNSAPAAKTRTKEID